MSSTSTCGPADAEAVPGVSARPLSAWLEQHVPEARPPFELSRIAGGRSNLTYQVRDAGGRRWVVRRPPLGGVLPSAHDVSREHAFLSALAPTGVPVPRPRAFCEDPSVVGSPFYVMDFVDGRVLESPASAEPLPEAARRRVAPALAAGLAELHAVDAAAVGLDGFGHPDRYMDRQIARWTEQWRSTSAGDDAASRTVERIARRLASRTPPIREATVVHGDFRLGNVVIDDRGGVAAILDWEMATRGDPLADLGLLLAHWSGPGDPPHPLGSAPAGLEGFHSRDELAHRYSEASGRDIGDVGYYIAFAYWKIAVILQGVHARSSVGAYGANGRETDEQLPAMVDRFLELAEDVPADRASRAG